MKINLKFKALFLSFFVFLISGCVTIEGEIASSENMAMDCVNTKSSEKFSFYTRTINNIRVGIGSDSSFDFEDMTGKKRSLSKSMESYIICIERNATVTAIFNDENTSMNQ